MDVTSFGIDHNRLLRGIYVSRKDTVGDGVLTTFDVRMKEPNREMVMDTSVMHTIEHLMATFFRAHPVWADQTIYARPDGLPHRDVCHLQGRSGICGCSGNYEGLLSIYGGL